MVNEELRNMLAEENPDIVLFDNPSFDNSIVGVNDGYEFVIYDYDKMAQELADDDGITIEEAMEFIDYNTLRTIPYIRGNQPVVMYSAERYF